MTNTETTAADKAAAVAEQGAHVAPEKASSKKGAAQRKGASKGEKTAKGGKAKAAAPKRGANARTKGAKPTAAKKASTPRPASKGAKILDMIVRAKGATLAEIRKATDWQAHSVRGFISTAGKKHNITIESSKNEAGDRIYRIAK